MTRLKERLFHPFIPDNGPQTVNRKGKEAGIITIGALTAQALGGIGVGMGIFDHGSLNLHPNELTIAAGFFSGTASLFVRHYGNLYIRYWEIQQKEREGLVSGQRVHTTSNASPSLIEGLRQLIGQIEQTGDLAVRAQQRSYLQEIHRLTGMALDLLRPAQGSTRPNSDKPADPFSGPKYQ